MILNACRRILTHQLPCCLRQFAISATLRSNPVQRCTSMMITRNKTKKCGKDGDVKTSPKCGSADKGGKDSKCGPAGKPSSASKCGPAGKSAKVAKCGPAGKGGKGSKGGKGDKSSKCGPAGKGGKQDENLSAVLHGIGDLRLETTPKPKISPEQVLLAIDSVGICGTDIHYLVHGAVGRYILKKPMVIGHESSGIVQEVGKSVKHLKKGDRVAIEPGVCCFRCFFCRRGRYNLCPNMRLGGLAPNDGSLRRYYSILSDFCYKLPDHVSMEEGALAEPLSIAVGACRRAMLKISSNVLILGAGPIGLVTLIAAKAAGVASTTIVDTNEHRLKVAQKLGVTNAVKSCKEMDIPAAANEIQKIIGTMPDRTIDCAGFEQTVRLGVYATQSGGILTVVGMGADEVKLPIMEALTREVDIRGTFLYLHDYPNAINIIKKGNTGIKQLVTHHFDFEKAIDAFATARDGKGNPIKVMIHVQKRDKNNKKPFDK